MQVTRGAQLNSVYVRQFLVLIFLAAGQNWSAAADEGLIEYDGQATGVTLRLTDCEFTKTVRYGNPEVVGQPIEYENSTVNLNRASLWVERTDNDTASRFKVTDNCESWRVADQCISIDDALAVVEEQDVLVHCDAMYVSCVRVDHEPEDIFTLSDSLKVLRWDDELGSENIRSQQHVLKSLDHEINTCKTRNNATEPVYREDNEGTVLQAQDRIREKVQDVDVEFRDVFVKGHRLMPTICGMVKHQGNDAFVRFMVFDIVGVKVEETPNDQQFERDVWGKYCL